MNNPLYSVRYGMIERCENTKSVGYKNYGGRGIKVCKKWRNDETGLQNFTIWAKNNGYKKGLELDRIDNDGNYKPLNCRFVTRVQQSRNKRTNLMFNHPVTGKLTSFRNIVDEMALPELTYRHVYERMYNGNSLEWALTTLLKNKLKDK